jgi:hypothetical protein
VLIERRESCNGRVVAGAGGLDARKAFYCVEDEIVLKSFENAWLAKKARVRKDPHNTAAEHLRLAVKCLTGADLPHSKQDTRHSWDFIRIYAKQIRGCQQETLSQ